MIDSHPEECGDKWDWKCFHPHSSRVIWLFWAIDAKRWTLIYPAKNAFKKVSIEVSQMWGEKELINKRDTQFHISYRPGSKQTNWVLFYLICFSVINSPAEGIIPSRKGKIRTEEKKHQIYHSAQMVGTAAVKHLCHYGIGNLVSWVWVEAQTLSCAS